MHFSINSSTLEIWHSHEWWLRWKHVLIILFFKTDILFASHTATSDGVVRKYEPYTVLLLALNCVILRFRFVEIGGWMCVLHLQYQDNMPLVFSLYFCVTCLRGGGGVGVSLWKRSCDSNPWCWMWFSLPLLRPHQSFFMVHCCLMKGHGEFVCWTGTASKKEREERRVCQAVTEVRTVPWLLGLNRWKG